MEVDFNPRSPRGLRPKSKDIGSIEPGISIHAAQEGCDLISLILMLSLRKFQSTQPKRAATVEEAKVAIKQAISIHAAQEGCDIDNFCPKKILVISIHAAQEGCDQQRMC